MSTTDSEQGTERTIDPELLAILVCPVDKQSLRLDGATLTCTVCGRLYPIEEGIPNMLVDEAP